MRSLMGCGLLLFLCLARHTAAAQQAASDGHAALKGVVLTEQDQPIAGVTVSIHALTNADSISSVLTDEKGVFVVDNLVPGVRYQFIFTHVSYEPAVVKSLLIRQGEDNTLLQRLKSAVSSLNDVVVVGYGSQSRAVSTGAISSLTSKDFNTGVYTSAVEMIQGKIPGLNISHDGNPLSTPSVVLRGPSTLREGAAQQPLYVVDGVPIPVDGVIDMTDIESVDVLKDAASTAIYGSRAANGVIMITTKKGKANGAKVSYNGFVGVEQISRRVRMMSAGQYRSYLKKNNLILDPFDEDGVSTDWQSAVTRTGFSHNHNLSASGGNGKTNYYSSVDYRSVQGIINGSDLNSVTFRGNLEQTGFNNHLKLSLNVSNNVSNTDDIPSDVLYNMIAALPTMKIRNADGTYKEDYNVTVANPVALIAQNTDNIKTKTLFGNAAAKLNVISGLDLNANVSYQNSQSNQGIYYDKASRLGFGLNGEAIRSAYESEQKLVETYGTYGRSFGDHEIKLLAGYSWQEQSSGDGFQATNQ
ncbi:MAG TPA: TonB-dependent receptor plug domain-containing protein, partial [Verrucomicrobiae bacterium]|nr:TonB-dependent receptor plug domain-containing protein [Verrucomicrobiae bacterium]